MDQQPAAYGQHLHERPQLLVLGEQLGQVLAIDDIWVASNLGGQVPRRREPLLAVQPGHGGGGPSGEAETQGAAAEAEAGVVAVVCGWWQGEERWKGPLL